MHTCSDFRVALAARARKTQKKTERALLPHLAPRTAAAVPQPNARAAIRAASFSAFGVGASILSSASKATESSNARTPSSAPPPRAMAETEPHAKRKRGGTSRPCFGVASASCSQAGNCSGGGGGGVGGDDEEDGDVDILDINKSCAAP